mgnify:FL=1
METIKKGWTWVKSHSKVSTVVVVVVVILILVW